MTRLVVLLMILLVPFAAVANTFVPGTAIPVPGPNTAPVSPGSNFFLFTAMTSDQALPTTGASALVLPGKVCLVDPAQVFGSGTLNGLFINVNWGGGNSSSVPTDQLAPGQPQRCQYISTTTPPHISVNGASGSVSIGVSQ